MYLGQNIKFLRKSQGLSQEELGELLGVTKTQIGNYERQTHEPKFKSLLKLSQHFDVLIDDLILKDLSKEKGKPASQSPANEAEEEQMIIALNDLLMKRVMQMEEEIKRLDPERARELGIK